MTVVDSGLEGVVVADTTIGQVDGAAGRLLYRGYDIGDLVAHGSYEQVIGLLLDEEWPADRGQVQLPTPASLPDGLVAVLRALPPDAAPLDALRTSVSAWGAERKPGWPPTADQARELIGLAPALLGAFGRIREGADPVNLGPAADLGVAGRLLYALHGTRPEPGAVRALDAYFIAAAEHGFNASTFTLRVVISTRSDLASAVCAAIGALKGPLHGGAPAGVESQLDQIGSVDRAEAWMRQALARGERLMGFGHRIYRHHDPRAAALREVAGQIAGDAEWLRLARQVEDVALRVLAEHKPDRPLPTNVEYYAAAVLHGVGLPADLYTPAFSIARMAGWCAHALEQARVGRLIRPAARYTGPTGRSLPHPAGV